MRNRCLDSIFCSTLPAVLLLLLAGCGSAAHAPAPTAPVMDSGLPVTGLPPLPLGADDPVLTRAASLTDNYQNGVGALKTSLNAVFVNGTGLDMGPAGKRKVCWAIWRWGAFQNGNKPRVFKTDITMGNQYSYWVVMADYTTNRWKISGPNKVGTASYTLTPGDNFLSPSANCYIGLIVSDLSVLTVNTLDLVCDNDATPPAAPTGLNASAITPHGALLKWTPPADPDLAGYVLYHGPSDTFQVGDSGVVADPVNIAVGATQVPLTGLMAQTPYHYRLLAVDSGGNTSPLSNAAAFTTKPNGPPVPAFSYSPTTVQKNSPVVFDPSGSSDPDDPLTALTCAWDWDNDGTADDTYLDANQTVQHSFPDKGPVTVKLTVSDGTASASTTQTFVVGQQTETRDMGFSTSGSPLNLLLGNAEYATGCMAALVSGGGGLQKLQFYNGTAWQELDVTQFTDFSIEDLLVDAGTVYLTVTQRSGGGSGSDLNWWIYSSSGGNWALFKNDTITGHPLTEGARLAFSSTGRMALAIGAAKVPSFKKNPNTALYIYHEKNDGSLLQYTVYQHDASNDDKVYNVPIPRVGLQRSDTTTYCAFTQNWQVAGPGFPDPDVLPRFTVGMATVTDAGGSQAALYDAVNSPGPLGGAVPLGCQCAKDPADETKMYWAILSDEGTIYFGDSFGSANDTSERFKPSPQAQYLLGAGLASDNQCLAYYTAIGTDGVGHAYGYKSQGAVTFDPIPGVGTISNGFGSWFSSGGDGLYLLGSEPRDGEVTGRFIVNGALTRTDLVAAPLEGLPTGDRSIAFITNTGGFEVLNRQNVPTAFRHSAASVGGTFTNSQLGLDTWAIPQAGASGTTAGEIILGSTYDPAVLVLSRFSAGNNVGDQLATFPDAAVYSICYNPALNRTGVAYTQNGGKDVLFRSWNGTVLSSAATVYTGTDALVEMVLKARPDGEWGVAWDDSASNVRLAETSSGTWQAPGTLSAQAVNFAVGSIGLGYAANNDAGIAVERSTGTTGLYFGLKPAGSGTATWELVSPSQGFNMKSISVNFMFGTTATLVYNDNTLGIEMALDGGSDWTVTNLPFALSGSPLATVLDDAGTLAVAGKNNLTGQAAVCFLSQ